MSNLLAIERYTKAVELAVKMHHGQVRKDESNTPYVSHCLEVSRLVQNNVRDWDLDLFIAALLHDVLEYTPCTEGQILKLFGKRVVELVREVTDDKSLPKHVRKQLQVERASRGSYGAKIIKLADKLSNLRSLVERAPPTWSPERVQGYFVWSFSVVKGLRETNVRLEHELDQIFAGSFQHQGVTLPCLPAEEERFGVLSRYYAEMAAAKD